jgi:hypothetical protein
MMPICKERSSPYLGSNSPACNHSFSARNTSLLSVLPYHKYLLPRLHCVRTSHIRVPSDPHWQLPAACRVLHRHLQVCGVCIFRPRRATARQTMRAGKINLSAWSAYISYTYRHVKRWSKRWPMLRDDTHLDLAGHILFWNPIVHPLAGNISEPLPHFYFSGKI